MSVRVRYAPSPTGLQHIGGVRTALINYLFAHSHGGTFIVRVEDTDQKRSRDEFKDDLFQTLAWLGIEGDESPFKGDKGPYVQSERFDIYTQYTEKLIQEGYAYHCYTSEQQEHQSKSYEEETYHDNQYDRSSRKLSEEEIETYKQRGIKPVVRLKLPLEGSISFTDELLGTITRDVSDVIVDPILLKADGFPTYHLANVIDDHLMGITHVMRSQEWIPTTPVHIRLYEAFGWEPPKFMHLPMVMGDDGQKLSKRNGSMSIAELRDMGILPQALINCIALLGWGYDDSREFFTKDELVELYKDGKINKSPSKFSMEKLRWFNAHYIREMAQDELATLILPYLKEKGWTVDEKIARELVPLVQERLEVLSDVVAHVSCVFEEIIAWDFSVALKKNKDDKESLLKGLDFAKKILEEHFDKNPQDIEQIIRDEMGKVGLKLGQILMPLRVAVTGGAVSPPILPLIKIIGKEKTIERINKSMLPLK